MAAICASPPSQGVVRRQSWSVVGVEGASDPNKPEATPCVKIVDAIQTFRTDEDSRRLTEGTLKKSQYLFEAQFTEWQRTRASYISINSPRLC